jgi:glycosyltransferase involved in cell wall biosynthesis
MLVTIITPSFNQAKYLEQTILSVLNQTYNNIEYIIMDGGSNDGSLDIIKKYEDKLTYWQSKSDGGQVKAINKAFQMAKGDLVAFINSDDILQPGAVEAFLRAYDVNPDYTVYYGLCNTIDSEGKEMSKPKGGNLHYDVLLKKGMLPAIYQPACFFNVRKINRSYLLDENYPLAFDYELLLYLLKQGSFLFLYSHFASYRVHDESKSIAQKREHYLDKLRVQEHYSKKYWLLWKYRRIKMEIAIRFGKF